jgi:hypothetical protein
MCIKYQYGGNISGYVTGFSAQKVRYGPVPANAAHIMNNQVVGLPGNFVEKAPVVKAGT